MKIREWVGVALCMVALGASAQEAPKKIGDWIVTKDEKLNIARHVAGSKLIHLSFGCETRTSSCQWMFTSSNRYPNTPSFPIVVTSQNKKYPLKFSCSPLELTEGSFCTIENKKNFESIITYSDFITIKVGKHSEEIRTNGATKVIGIVKEKVKKYAMEDDGLYGYESYLTDDEIKEGKKSSDLYMARYAGEKNSVHQIFTDSTESVAIHECEIPCEFYKSMYFDKSINKIIETKRYRTQNGTVIHAVLSDAMNGLLTPSVIKNKNGTQKSIWFDEQKGMILTPVNQ